MKLAVDGSFGRVHVERDSVIDPVTDSIVFQRPIGDRGRERERRWIERRQIEVKIDRA